MAYADNTNVGTATITITGKGNYSGTLTYNFAITAATQTGVSASGYSGSYDGLAHGITVTAEGSVTYSTTGSDYTADNPTYTDAGTYTVYYKVTRANYDDVTGSETVVISRVTPVISISADKSTLSGRGTVTLTVSGAPAEGTINVTCDAASITVTDNGDGTFSAELPNTTATYTFTAAYTAAENGNYNDVGDATCSVSVTRRSSGGSSSGSSSSGASSTITIPVSGDEATIHEEITVSGSTATLEEIEIEELEKVIGQGVSTGVVKVDLTGLDADIDSLNLPITTVEAVVEAAEHEHNDTEALSILFKQGTVTLDDASMRAIVEQVQGETVCLTLEANDGTNLSDVQKNAVTDLVVCGGLSVQLRCVESGEIISDFNGGTVTLSVAFEMPDVRREDGFSAWHVAEDGNTLTKPRFSGDK